MCVAELDCDPLPLIPSLACLSLVGWLTHDVPTVDCLLYGLQTSMYSEFKGELTYSSCSLLWCDVTSGKAFILSVSPSW